METFRKINGRRAALKKNEQRRQRYGALDWIRGIT